MSFYGKIRSGHGPTIIYEIFIIIIIIILFLPLLFFTPRLVGDGGEYYALYFAWKDTLKPFMSNESWSTFQQFATSNEVLMPPNYAELLKKTFEVLTLGSTSDFNHFWFYSLLASLLNRLLGILFINPSTHLTFIITHWMLICLPTILANRFFGMKGAVGVVMLTLFSPMIWYVDKVHTEFFTYCLTLSAVIFFIQRHYLFSFLCLAIVSTQNISFSAVAAIPLIIDFFHRKEKTYSYLEVGLVLLGIFFILLHPLYYLFRYGVLTPQLFAGGAKVGANFKYLLIWLIDPDVGLLPNWPFGIFIIVIVFMITIKKTKPSSILYLDINWWIFLIGYLLISLFSQSSTENLNSGATPGISRYALWYISLFFPFLLIILSNFGLIRPTKHHVATFSILMVGFLLYSQLHYKPTLPDNCITPSFTSQWTQKNFSTLYNPPPEIFAERFGRIGEQPTLNQFKVLAVFGPDCRKILLRNIPHFEIVLGQKDCNFDYEKLVSFLKNYLLTYSVKGHVYLNLTQSEADQFLFDLKFNVWYPAKIGSIATTWLEFGWSSPESSGTWSSAKLARLSLPCPKGNSAFKLEFEMGGFLIPQHPSIGISFISGNKTLYSNIFKGDLSSRYLVGVEPPIDICKNSKSFELDIKLSEPVSPFELGLSADTRHLGVALIKLRYTYPTDTGSNDIHSN